MAAPVAGPEWKQGSHRGLQPDEFFASITRASLKVESEQRVRQRAVTKKGRPDDRPSVEEIWFRLPPPADDSHNLASAPVDLKYAVTLLAKDKTLSVLKPVAVH